MEMNTRLQVEHPVSEAISGLDLVEMQLRVAYGEPLPVSQSELQMTGHAFEARLYAEDVAKGFLPATGALDCLSFPQHTAFENGTVRIDSGVGAGDSITPFYDPMIAKIIVHAPDRSTALNTLNYVLSESLVIGCITNLQFLSALTRHTGFKDGDVDTGLIARDLDALTSGAELDDDVKLLAGVLALDLVPAKKNDKTCDPWTHFIGWRHWGSETRTVNMQYNDAALQQRLCIKNAETFSIDDSKEDFHVESLGDHKFAITHNGERHSLRGIKTGRIVTIVKTSNTFSFILPNPLLSADMDERNANTVIAPMPGLVSQVLVKAGADVEEGDALLMLEAMKMEHVLTAPRNGQIAELLVSEGDQVQDGALLIALVEELKA